MSSEVSAAQYNEFLDGLDLKGIKLVSGSMKLMRETPRDSRLRVETRSESTHSSSEAGRIKVNHNYIVDVKTSDSEEPALVVTCEFALVYLTKAEMTDEIWHRFSETNLFLNTWPYMREFVHNMLGRADILGIIAPVYRV